MERNPYEEFLDPSVEEFESDAKGSGGCPERNRRKRRSGPIVVKRWPPERSGDGNRTKWFWFW